MRRVAWRATVGSYQTRFNQGAPGRCHVGRVGFLGQPLGLRIAVLARQSAQQVVGAVPVPARTVGDIDDRIRSRPRLARQAEVERIAGRVPPPVVLVQIHAQTLAGHVHELEQVFDAVLPIADAFVAGPVVAQGVRRPAELVQRKADPQLGVFHFVEYGQPGHGQVRRR